MMMCFDDVPKVRKIIESGLFSKDFSGQTHEIIVYGTQMTQITQILLSVRPLC
jgi:hypothetical protein